MGFCPLEDDRVLLYEVKSFKNFSFPRSIKLSNSSVWGLRDCVVYCICHGYAGLCGRWEQCAGLSLCSNFEGIYVHRIWVQDRFPRGDIKAYCFVKTGHTTRTSSQTLKPRSEFDWTSAGGTRTSLFSGGANLQTTTQNIHSKHPSSR